MSSLDSGDFDENELLQAWIERAQGYWSSLTSKIKAVAFVSPNEIFVDCEDWNVGDVFDVSVEISKFLGLPQPESIRTWFTEVIHLLLRLIFVKF